jgi:hypothetical protein
MKYVSENSSRLLKVLLITVEWDQQRPAGPPRKIKVSDCQWWIMQVVEKLIEEMILMQATRGPNKGRDPMEILHSTSKH